MKAAALIHSDWEVRPPKMGRTADRSKEITHGSKVKHLLDGDASDQSAPAANLSKLGIGDPFVRAVLQAERREQIAAHDSVLDFRSFRQEVDQLRTVLDT
jgi:hypothetical protein